jgi:hypothetical protein
MGMDRIIRQGIAMRARTAGRSFIGASFGTACAVMLALAPPALAQFGAPTTNPLGPQDAGEITTLYGNPFGTLYGNPFGPQSQFQIGGQPGLQMLNRPSVGPWQQTPDVAPWDAALRRFYERDKILDPVDPLARSERAARSIYESPAKKLGLPQQYSPDRLFQQQQQAEIPLSPGIVALDANHDGGISRREYMEQKFRNRGVAPGPAAEARRRNVMGRVRARFNGVDQDGNGVLDARELRGVLDPRF